MEAYCIFIGILTALMQLAYTIDSFVLSKDLTYREIVFEQLLKQHLNNSL